MIDLSDGLASDLMQLCKASQCGVRIYLDRIPIARQTSALADEMHMDPVVAALNGGEDYELLFTVPLTMQEQVMRLGLVDVIGHITPRIDRLLPRDPPTDRTSASGPRGFRSNKPLKIPRSKRGGRFCQLVPN